MPRLRQLPAIDLVFGGPPCQGFSVAGKMDPGDPRSRLVLDFMDAVGAVRPKAFVMENVKALAVNSRWESVRSTLAAKAQEHGYCAAMVVLRASHYGVPQQRERMFFVGFQQSLAGSANGVILHELLDDALRPSRKRPETLRSIIGRIGRAGSPGNPWGARAKVTYAKSPVLRASAYAGMLFNGAGRPLSPDGFSCTLSATMGGNKTPIIDEAVFFDGADSFVERYHAHLIAGGTPRSGTAPGRLRRMTLREVKALMTFPDDYLVTGEAVAQYRQLGNAVPCGLAHAVGAAMLRLLSTFERQAEKSRTRRALANRPAGARAAAAEP